MCRRRQTANIPNLTNSNRQDPQHMAAADISYVMRVSRLTHPKPSHINWHDPRNLTVECKRTRRTEDYQNVHQMYVKMYIKCTLQE